MRSLCCHRAKAVKLKSIVTFDGELEQAIAGQAITLTLEDEIDISRGDLIVSAQDSVRSSDHFRSHVGVDG